MIVTGWEEITVLDKEFDAMDRPVVVDGRRAISRREYRLRRPHLVTAPPIRFEATPNRPATVSITP